MEELLPIPPEPISEFTGSLIEKNQQLKTENKHLIKANRIIQNIISHRDAWVKELMEKLNIKERELADALKMVSQLKEEANNLALCSNQEEANADLQAQMHQVETENHQLKEKVEQQDELIANFKTEEDKLTAELSEWKRPTNKVRKENFQLKKEIEILADKNAKLAKILVEERDVVSRVLEVHKAEEAKRKNEEVAAEAKQDELKRKFSELKLSTDKKIVEYEKQVEDLKAKKVSQGQAKVGLVKEFLEEDRRFQLERDLRFVKLCKSLAAIFDLQTDDEFGDEQGQEAEKKEDTALEEARAPTSENASSAGESNADANIELDVAESLRGSPSESPIPVVVSREELERDEAEKPNVDTEITEIIHDTEQETNLFCHVCDRQFKYKKSLRRHLTFTSCGESLNEEDTATFDLEQDQLPFQSSATLDNKSEQQSKQDTRKPPSPSTSYSSGKVANKQTEGNAKPVLDGATDLVRSPSNETSSASDTKADSIVKSDVPATLTATPSDSALSVATLEFRCTVCNRQFKSKMSLENHRMDTKCGKSITKGGITTTTDLKQEKASSSASTFAVAKQSKKHIKQDKHDTPSPSTSSPKKKVSALNRRAVQYHRKDYLRSRAEKGHYCLCGEQFPSHAFLEDHLDERLLLVTFLCRLCNKKCDDSVKLNEHMRTAHGV